MRKAISLTEVLIAMGILTVGLLGVASVFPVASAFMQQGDVADRSSQIAQAAFNDALARGTFDPANWYAMSRGGFEPSAYSVPGDGPFDSFSRPVADSINNARALWPNDSLCQRVGQVYVIDPLGAAAMSNEQSPTANNLGARVFPASAAVLNLRSNYYNMAWEQWLSDSQSIWPVRRVTMRQPFVGSLPPNPTYWQITQPLTTAVAERRFSSSDDLAIDIPPQADKPSRQLLQLDANSSPLARQSAGNYSWLATVVPKDPWSLVGSLCEVSVVVFYKRVLDGKDDILAAASTERIVKASVQSTGLAGGELLLSPVNDGITESPFQGLKVGRWIMLCGPSPSSTSERPQFVARWYRVLSIEEQGDNRLATLRGPQWPWQPRNGSGELSNNLCVGIFPGAVAVHSKTIRLGGQNAYAVK